MARGLPIGNTVEHRFSAASICSGRNAPDGASRSPEFFAMTNLGNLLKRESRHCLGHFSSSQLGGSRRLDITRDVTRDMTIARYFLGSTPNRQPHRDSRLPAAIDGATATEPDSANSSAIMEYVLARPVRPNE